MAPTKVLIVPLSVRKFDDLVREVCESITPARLPRTAADATCTALKLRKAGVFSRVDDSNQSIGKRYARNDELGTPFGLTLDFACMWSCVIFAAFVRPLT